MLSLATETDRTLFFDFLPIEIGTIRGMRTRIQLYTVPGQVFYNATRRMVLKGADAVCFVADSQEAMLDANLESYENMRQNLEANEIDPDEIPVVLQYNKRDLPNALPIEILNERMNPLNAPVLRGGRGQGHRRRGHAQGGHQARLQVALGQVRRRGAAPAAPGRAPGPPRSSPPPPRPASAPPLPARERRPAERARARRPGAGRGPVVRDRRQHARRLVAPGGAARRADAAPAGLHARRRSRTGASGAAQAAARASRSPATGRRRHSSPSTTRPRSCAARSARPGCRPRRSRWISRRSRSSITRRTARWSRRARTETAAPEPVLHPDAGHDRGRGADRHRGGAGHDARQPQRPAGAEPAQALSRGFGGRLRSPPNAQSRKLLALFSVGSLLLRGDLVGAR